MSPPAGVGCCPPWPMALLLQGGRIWVIAFPHQNEEQSMLERQVHMPSHNSPWRAHDCANPDNIELCGAACPHFKTYTRSRINTEQGATAPNLQVRTCCDCSRDIVAGANHVCSARRVLTPLAPPVVDARHIRCQDGRCHDGMGVHGAPPSASTTSRPYLLWWHGTTSQPNIKGADNVGMGDHDSQRCLLHNGTLLWRIWPTVLPSNHLTANKHDSAAGTCDPHFSLCVAERSAGELHK